MSDSGSGSGSDSASEYDWDWERFVTPQGEIYYYAKSRRLATNSDLSDPNIRQQIEDEAGGILEETEEKNPSMRLAEWDWWLVYVDDDSSMLGGVFVNHKDFKQVQFTDSGEVEPCAEGKYWEFLLRYPMHLENSSPKAEAAFLSTLVRGASERMTSRLECRFPFSEADCQRLLEIYRDLKRQISDVNLAFGDNKARQQLAGTLNWFMAEAMVEISGTPLIAKYGTPGASVRKAVPKTFEKTWAVRAVDMVFGVLLLGMHTTYRRRLWNAWPGFVIMHNFHALISGAMQEWTDSTLLATVFVAANVAFLAIPDITDAQRIISIVSTLFCMGSILVGVHHNWRHRQQLGTDVETHAKVDADFRIAGIYFEHLAERFGRNISVTLQAGFLSLPIVMLLWAAITFITAVGTYSIQNTILPRTIGFAILVGILALFAIGTLVYFTYIWSEGSRREENVDTRMRFVHQVKEFGKRAIIGTFSALGRLRRRHSQQNGEGGTSDNTQPV